MAASDLLCRNDLATWQQINAMLPRARHKNTFANWRVRGVRGTKLPAVYDGERWLFSLSDFFEFYAKISKTPIPSTMAATTYQEQPCTSSIPPPIAP